MDQDSFIEYAMRYLLVPGQQVSAQGAIQSVGYLDPLPPELQRLLERSDLLGHRGLVITESDPLMIQWNPFSGCTPIYTEGAFGVGLIANHRWMQGMHEAAVKVLYHVIHESVHAVWAAWGLQGLLSMIPTHKRADFHAMSEACAVLIGDLEAHQLLRDFGTFKRFWPSGDHQSHAVSFSALKALEAAGLGAGQRAEWLLSVYLDQVRSLPQRPDDPGLSAEALAFLIEESSYAEKIDLNTTPYWLRYYWDRPEIEAFMRDFVPAAPLILPGIPEPISTVDDCRKYWREILLGELTLGSGELAYQRARLSLQRAALRVAELSGVFESYRLCASQAIRDESIQLCASLRTELLACFQSLFSAPRGSLEEEVSRAHIDQAEAHLLKLQTDLMERLGPTLLLEHPHLDELPFRDVAPPLHDRATDEPRAPSELRALLTLISEEAHGTHLNIKRAPQYYSEIYQRNQETYLEAHRLLGALALDDSADTCRLITDELRALKRRRALWLSFPLEWITACPFIDPLIGFRYR